MISAEQLAHEVLHPCRQRPSPRAGRMTLTAGGDQCQMSSSLDTDLNQRHIVN